MSGSDANYLPVDYLGIEELVLVGQLDADLGLGLFDTFAVDGTLGEDVFEYFTGDTPDTGTVRGLMNVISATPFALPKITFQGMHPAGVRSFGMTTYDPANNDDFLFYATSLDDQIVYDGSTIPGPGYHSLTDSIDGSLVTNIQLGLGITGVVISAENGSDTIDVTPGDGVSVIVQGGNPGGGSDVMNYHAVGETTVELATSDIEDAGYGGTREASFSGIEVLNVDAAASQFNVTATDVDDDVTVTVYDANSGMVQHGYAAQRAGQVASEIADPVIYYTNTDGNAANFDLGGGEDTLIVIGSTYGTTPPAADEPQVFDVNASDTDTTIPGRLPDPIPARQVRVDNEGDNTNDGVVTWTTDGIESLEVWGLEGDDTFNVVPGEIPVFIDGGDPIGTSAGDLINIIADGDPVVFEPGPESDEGGFIVGARQRVSFDHIEALGVFNAAKAIIIGTGADDEITIIARDDSTHPALVGFTPGEQDFTTTVNDGPEILWADTPKIFVDAGSGDDDITLRTPAPNLAQWDVEVFVAGGPASTPELGDRLRVETPYEDNDTVYQPTAPDSGIMWIYNTSGDLHSTIYIGGWDLIHGVDPDPVLEYHSSPGGVETLLYDGISAEGTFHHDNNTDETTQNPADAFTDTLTILGDGFAQEPSDDHFVHTPGNAPDAGSVAMIDLTNGQTMLGISYNNIGLDGLVTIDGQDGTDTLVALGTGGSDVMDVAFSATDAIDVDLTSSVGAHVDLRSLQIENYQIRPEEGDDEVTVVAPILASGDFAVLGGGPGGSDVINFDLTLVDGADASVGPDLYDSSEVNVFIDGALTDVSDFELIRFIGDDLGGQNDFLTYDLGVGDHNIRVEDGPALTPLFTLYDRVTSTVLPIVEYGNMYSFSVLSAAYFGFDNGANEVTFATGGLIGSEIYTTHLNELDTLIIEGESGSADHILLREPDGPGSPGTVEITDVNAPLGAVVITDVTLADGALGSVVINTLGGDDLIEVDAGGGLIRVPITIDGGANSDALYVYGDPSAAEADDVDLVEYLPGPDVLAGRLRYDLDSTTPDTQEMLIDFIGLEPVLDLVPAATLAVNGTPADNAISYTESPSLATWGMVTVDAYETIEFANKTELVLDALAGDDVVSINNQSTPDGLTLITVDGGDPTASDKLVYTGSGEIIVTQGASPYVGTITNLPLPPVAFADIEHVAVTATGDTDIVAIEGTTDSERITIDVGDAFGEGAAQVDSGFSTTFTGAERVDVVANEDVDDAEQPDHQRPSGSRSLPSFDRWPGNRGLDGNERERAPTVAVYHLWNGCGEPPPRDTGRGRSHRHRCRRDCRLRLDQRDR